jgi:hypothetical protein
MNAVKITTNALTLIEKYGAVTMIAGVKHKLMKAFSQTITLRHYLITSFQN